FLWWDKIRAIALLSNMVTTEGTRDILSEENLISETRRMPLIWLFRGDLKKLLNKLPEQTGLLRRSLTSGTPYFELTSESLIPWILEYQQRFRRFALAIWSYGAGLLVLLLICYGYVAYQVGKSAKAEAEAANVEAQAAKKQLGALEPLVTRQSADLKSKQA